MTTPRTFETLHAQYLAQFASYTLTEIGPGVPHVRVFHLRAPGGGAMEGVEILFTSAPTRERIVVVGDLSPNDNQGCVSNAGYGIRWFARRWSNDHLASKFLQKVWVPDLALAALQSLLDDARKDSEANAEVVHERATERAFKRLAAIEEAIAASEGEPDGERATTRSAETFHEWYQDTFEDPPESTGFGYQPREAALLCAIQETFARLYEKRESEIPGGGSPIVAAASDVQTVHLTWPDRDYVPTEESEARRRAAKPDSRWVSLVTRAGDLLCCVDELAGKDEAGNPIYVAECSQLGAKRVSGRSGPCETVLEAQAEAEGLAIEIVRERQAELQKTLDLLTGAS